MNFDTTLLREKFLITEENSKNEPLRVVSNRLSLLLKSHDGQSTETFVVRAQTMHICIRMAAQIMQSYQRNGLTFLKQDDFDWQELWDKVVNPHDKKHNPHLWGAVYRKGVGVFKSGNVHSFLNMIEKCDISSDTEYDNSVSLAEKAFAKTGKTVSIEHENNMGLVINATAESGRCGIILRNALESATFSFSVKPKENAEEDALNVTPSLCLNTSAAFLEGIQLAFTNGMGKAGIGNISDAQINSATKRLGEINREISQFENIYDVTYRPDRPVFGDIITTSETHFRAVSA